MEEDRGSTSFPFWTWMVSCNQFQMWIFPLAVYTEPYREVRSRRSCPCQRGVRTNYPTSYISQTSHGGPEAPLGSYAPLLEDQWWELAINKHLLWRRHKYLPSPDIHSLLQNSAHLLKHESRQRWHRNKWVSLCSHKTYLHRQTQTRCGPWAAVCHPLVLDHSGIIQSSGLSYSSSLLF